MSPLEGKLRDGGTQRTKRQTVARPKLFATWTSLVLLVGKSIRAKQNLSCRTSETVSRYLSRLDLRGLELTVPGTAKPLNSRLQLSQSRLYRNRIFDHIGVGRYPRRTRELRHFGQFCEIIRVKPMLRQLKDYFNRSLSLAISPLRRWIVSTFASVPSRLIKNNASW